MKKYSCIFYCRPSFLDYAYVTITATILLCGIVYSYSYITLTPRISLFEPLKQGIVIFSQFSQLLTHWILIHWINFMALIIHYNSLRRIFCHMQYHNYSNITILCEYAVLNHGNRIATVARELKMASKECITMMNTERCMALRALIILIE